MGGHANRQSKRAPQGKIETASDSSGRLLLSLRRVRDKAKRSEKAQFTHGK